MEKEKIDRFSKISFSKIKSDYRNYPKLWFAVLLFIIPFIGVLLIYRFADLESGWYTFGIILSLWSLFGLYHSIKPIILRVILPLTISLFKLFSYPFQFLQFFLASWAEDLEKNLNDNKKVD